VVGLWSLDEEEWCEVPVGAAVVFAPSFGVAEFLVLSLPVVWGVAVCFGAAVCVVPVGWEFLPTRAAEGHESADVFPAARDDDAGVVVFADVGVTILAILNALRSIRVSNVFKQCEFHLCN